MRRLRLSAALLAAIVGGVFAASAIVPAAQPPQPPQLDALPGTDSIDRTAPDPDGDAAWAVRVYTSSSGAACSELGRLRGDRFGAIGPDGRFAELPLAAGGTCGDLRTEPALVAVNTYPSGPGRPARTVVFGQSANAASVAVAADGRAITVTPGPRGAFVVALDVRPDEVVVDVTFADGTARDYRLATTPGGAAPAAG